MLQLIIGFSDFGPNLPFCMLGTVILLDFLLFTDFFSKTNLKKIFSGIATEYQKAWIEIRPDILSGLIMDQTVCKGYQQRTLAEFKLIVNYN